MTLDHVAKVGDDSLILALPNGGTLRLAHGGKIIGTNKKTGRIEVIK